MNRLTNKRDGGFTVASNECRILILRAASREFLVGIACPIADEGVSVNAGAATNQYSRT